MPVSHGLPNAAAAAPLSMGRTEPPPPMLPPMPFGAADLDRPLSDVFPASSPRSALAPELVAAARAVDFDCCERWGDRITDDLVNGLGAFTGGVAEFKEAYARCQAHHAVVYAGEETLREWAESYRAKAHRFDPGAPLPDLPADGGDLVGFLRAFTVEQMLAVGW